MSHRIVHNVFVIFSIILMFTKGYKQIVIKLFTVSEQNNCQIIFKNRQKPKGV